MTNHYSPDNMKWEMDGNGRHRILPDDCWCGYQSPATYTAANGRMFVAFTAYYFPFKGEEGTEDYHGPWAETIYELTEVMEHDSEVSR